MLVVNTCTKEQERRRMELWKLTKQHVVTYTVTRTRREKLRKIYLYLLRPILLETVGLVSGWYCAI